MTKKIREDDEQDKVGNQGWNDLADFEIGQTVPYRYESNMLMLTDITIIITHGMM